MNRANDSFKLEKEGITVRIGRVEGNDMKIKALNVWMRRKEAIQMVRFSGRDSRLGRK